MTTVTDSTLAAFKEAYAIDYGEELTDAEAREMLTRLVRFYERLAEPLPSVPPVVYGDDPVTQAALR